MVTTLTLTCIALMVVCVYKGIKTLVIALFKLALLFGAMAALGTIILVLHYMR